MNADQITPKINFVSPNGCLKNKYDPRKHAKQHETDCLLRGISFDFVDRLTVPCRSAAFTSWLRANEKASVFSTNSFVGFESTLSDHSSVISQMSASAETKVK